MSLDNQELGAQANRRSPRGNVAQESKGITLLSQKRRFTIAELPELPSEDRDLEDNREALKENGHTSTQMFEESQKGSKFQEGEVVEGQVVNVNSDFVTIDIGYKSEGQVSSSEFYDNTGKLLIAAGDHTCLGLHREDRRRRRPLGPLEGEGRRPARVG